MDSGAWVYNFDKKRYEWVENGKVYESPEQAPSHHSERPWHDPGKKIVTRNDKDE